MIGVDLGGTNVRAAAYHQDGTSAGPKFSEPSQAKEGPEHVFASIASVIRQAVDTAECPATSVGIAVPGVVDDAAGVVSWAPNFGRFENGVFYHWKDQPLRDPLSKLIELPIHLGNDANLAALGEYLFGTGWGSAKCLVMLTVGTGIGGGVVMAPDAVFGQAGGPLVLLGGNQGGAELGHMVIHHHGPDCSAGSYGALEAFCQRDAIVKRAVHRLMRGRKSALMDMVGGDLARLSPRHLSEAADQGDELAIEVWAEVGEMLGVGIGNCINVFAPEVVAIGGQIAKAGEWLLGPARRSARNVAIPALYEYSKIVQAQRIEDAGTLGGAALALEAAKWNKTLSS